MVGKRFSTATKKSAIWPEGWSRIWSGRSVGDHVDDGALSFLHGWIHVQRLRKPQDAFRVGWALLRTTVWQVLRKMCKSLIMLTRIPLLWLWLRLREVAVIFLAQTASKEPASHQLMLVSTQGWRPGLGYAAPLALNRRDSGGHYQFCILHWVVSLLILGCSFLISHSEDR